MIDDLLLQLITSIWNENIGQIDSLNIFLSQIQY